MDTFTHSSDTTTICNGTNTCKFSGLMTTFSKKPALCEHNQTGQLVFCHVTNAGVSTMCCCFSCVVSLTYCDGDMSYVSSEDLRHCHHSPPKRLTSVLHIRGVMVHVFVPNRHGTCIMVRCMQSDSTVSHNTVSHSRSTIQSRRGRAL